MPDTCTIRVGKKCAVNSSSTCSLSLVDRGEKVLVAKKMKMTIMRNRNNNGVGVFSKNNGGDYILAGGPCKDDSKDGKGGRASKREKEVVALWTIVLGVVLLISVLGVAVVIRENGLENTATEQGVHNSRSLHRNNKQPPYRSTIGGGIRKMEKCPEEFKKTFFVDGRSKINQPPARALRMQGWRKTDYYEEAQVIWTYAAKTSWFNELQPWQRYNHIPNYKSWNQKDSFVTHMMNYSATTGKEIVALPETYRLDEEVGLAQFKRRLFEEGALDSPWVLKKPNVNQGKGIKMLGPGTEELKNVFDLVKKEAGKQNYIIQKYVCNEMTINNRKFDFRVFWIVASLDPVIVMYHDGYLRIGNSDYSEGDFSNTQAHLTTHTGLAEEGKGTWDQFADYVAEVNNKENLNIQDPISHVRNQVKQVLGEMAAAFKDVTFNANTISSENGFGFYGADFIIDLDLDVYFIEPQHGCGLDEDFQFRVDMHNALFTQMIAATEEIWERQEQGLTLDNKSLINHGDYEIVYNDGWMYDYEGYQRSKNKRGCELAQTKK